MTTAAIKQIESIAASVGGELTDLKNLVEEILFQAMGQVTSNQILLDGLATGVQSNAIRSVEEWQALMRDCLPKELEQGVWVNSQAISKLTKAHYPLTAAEADKKGSNNNVGGRNMHLAKLALAAKGFLKQRRFGGGGYQYALR